MASNSVTFDSLTVTGQIIDNRPGRPLETFMRKNSTEVVAVGNNVSLSEPTTLMSIIKQRRLNSVFFIFNPNFLTDTPPLTSLALVEYYGATDMSNCHVRITDSSGAQLYRRIVPGDSLWVGNWGGPNYVNSPHLWVTNGTEIDLGDGSFGRRYVGTITGAANTRVTTTLLSLTSGISNWNIFDSGGWWTSPSQTGTGRIQLGNSDSNGKSSAIYNTPANSIVLITQSDQARTDTPYDIWFRYTKP